MLDALVWFVSNVGLGFYNFLYAITHPASWLGWADREALVRFIYYGASVEFFFVVFDIVLVLTAIFIAAFVNRLRTTRRHSRRAREDAPAMLAPTAAE